MWIVRNVLEQRFYRTYKDNYFFCHSVGSYMFKVNYRDTRTRREICSNLTIMTSEWRSKLTIKTPEWRHSRHSGIFIVNFGRRLVSLLLALNIFYTNVPIYLNIFERSSVKGQHKHRIFSNKRSWRLFSFEALTCGTHWRVALKRGRRLFQSKKKYCKLL